MDKQKIFCIGFQKTGTSSMGRALEQLGYRVCGAVGLKEADIDANIREIAYGEVQHFDAFQDNPWPILYRDLDERWPGSRFILTLRNEDQWISSVVRHFGVTPHPMQEWVYGTGYPKGHEDTFLRRYRQHNAEVLKYFEARPRDLLVIDISNGDLWGPLCEFLAVEKPATEFPHANKGGFGWKFLRWLKRRSKRIMNRLTRHQDSAKA